MYTYGASNVFSFSNVYVRTSPYWAKGSGRVQRVQSLLEGASAHDLCGPIAGTPQYVISVKFEDF